MRSRARAPRATSCTGVDVTLQHRGGTRGSTPSHERRTPSTLRRPDLTGDERRLVADLRARASDTRRGAPDRRRSGARSRGGHESARPCQSGATPQVTAPLPSHATVRPPRQAPRSCSADERGPARSPNRSAIVAPDVERTVGGVTQPDAPSGERIERRRPAPAPSSSSSTTSAPAPSGVRGGSVTAPEHGLASSRRHRPEQPDRGSGPARNAPQTLETGRLPRSSRVRARRAEPVRSAPGSYVDAPGSTTAGRPSSQSWNESASACACAGRNGGAGGPQSNASHTSPRAARRSRSREDGEARRRRRQVERGRDVERAVVEERRPHRRAARARRRTPHPLDRSSSHASPPTSAPRGGRAGRAGGTRGCARSGRRPGAPAPAAHGAGARGRGRRARARRARAAEHERPALRTTWLPRTSSSTFRSRNASCRRRLSTTAGVASSGARASAATQLPTRVESGYGCHASPGRGGLPAIHVSRCERASATSPRRTAARMSSP